MNITIINIINNNNNYKVIDFMILCTCFLICFPMSNFIFVLTHLFSIQQLINNRNKLSHAIITWNLSYIVCKYISKIICNKKKIKSYTKDAVYHRHFSSVSKILHHGSESKAIDFLSVLFLISGRCEKRK